MSWMFRAGRLRAGAVLSGLTAMAAATDAEPAAAAARPDLGVTALGTAPRALTAGETFRLRATVRNTGGSAAPATPLVFVLSRDGRYQAKRDVVLGRTTIPKLAPRRTTAPARRLTVPRSTAAGVYRILACVRPAKRARDRSTKNDCRVAGRTVRIAAAAKPPQPPAGSPLPGGGGGPLTPPPPAGGGAGAAGPVRSLPPAHPLDATLALDPAGTVGSMLITPDAGGMVAARYPDGRWVFITFPPGAVPSPVQVTARPLKSVGGTPLSGGLIAGVQLEPEGLQLLKPAAMSFLGLPALPPTAHQTGFGAMGDGRDFHLAGLRPIDRPELDILSFSAHGVMAGTPAEQAQQRDNGPRNPAERLEQLAHEKLSAQREAAIAGQPTPGLGDAMTELTRGYFNEVVLPAVDRARADDRFAESATQLLLGWARQVDMIGQETDLAAERAQVGPLLEELLDLATAGSARRCVESRQPAEAMRLIGLVRQRALIGQDEPSDLAALQRCARFELDVQATAGQDVKYTKPQVEANESMRVSARAQHIQLHHDHPFLAPTGQSPLAVTGSKHSYTLNDDTVLQDGGCYDMTRTLGSVTPTRPFTVLALQLSAVVIERPQPDGTFSTSYELADIDLRIDPGAIKETYAIKNRCSGMTTDTRNNWSTVMTTNLERLFTGASDFISVRGWAIADGGASATRGFSRDQTTTAAGGATSTTIRSVEQSMFELRHTPG